MKPPLVAYTFAQILNECPPLNLRRAILPALTIVLGVLVAYLWLSL